MTLRRRSSKKYRSFDVPVSFKINETGEKLRDALNVFSNQGRLETRFGRSLFASLSGAPLSMTFFKNAADARYLTAKVGTSIYSVTSAGVVAEIKSGLSSSTKHRGRTWARGESSRQIYAVGSDGLFQWNGSIFTQLGQAPPAAPTVASSATAGTLSGFNYNVYLTFYASSTGFESNASAAAAVSISASLVVQDLTYRAKQPGAEGNLITIAYADTATAGSETVTVTNNAIALSIDSGVTTANQIKTIIEKSVEASALVTVEVSSVGTDAQVTAAATALASGRQSIAITNIPATAANGLIDTVRVYLQDSDTADNAVFVDEVSLGTTSLTISADPESTSTYPTAHGAPPNGGGKYLLEFNRKLVVLGNSTYPNDVIFSEEDLPDAFNDGTASGFNRLYMPLEGVVTGGAVGLYSNSVLDPYMIVFKRRSTHLYSEIAGEGKQVVLSDKIGCVSMDSVVVKNGNIYFLSDSGWRVIVDGRIVTDKLGNAVTLGMGDIDDIFRSGTGYVYGLNKASLENSFSVYYSTLDQYFTWVPEGSNAEFSRAYVYEFQSGGFKPYVFYTAPACACVGEDASGDEAVFMADNQGKIYTHSTNEARSDEDGAGDPQAIEAFAMLAWLDGGDFESSCNFRNLTLRAVGSSDALTVKSWINFTLENFGQESYDFTNPTSGFILDMSELDEGVFGDERNIVTARADINRTGESLLIGFYQSIIDANINLIGAQLEFNKNGNRNA